MPSREDDLSRDERDAVSAEELLRRLKGEMESKDNDKADRAEALPKEDSHISDEASKTAEEGIVRGNPDEFGEDLESLMRMVMNMPADEAEETSSELEEDATSDAWEAADEPGITETQEAALDDTPAQDSVSGDTLVYSQLSFDSVSEDAADDGDEELAEDAEETENDDPWYDDDEEILKALAAEEDTDGGEAEEDADAHEEKSFLTEVAKMVLEEHDEPIPDEEDDFDFVTDEIDAEDDEDDLSNTYGDAVVGEDGGREYSDINGGDFNSTEISLISLFGDKEKLEEAYGKDKAEEIIEAANKPFVPETPVKKKFYERFASDCEYVSHEQDEEIKSRFSKAFGFTAVKFVLCIVFAALLFVFENMSIFKITPANVLNVSIYPTVCAMIDLQLVLLCALMAYKSVAYGFVSLAKLKPVPESVTAILLTASVVYTAVISTSAGIRSASFYNFPAALAIVFTLLCELLNIKREAMGFSVVSSSRRKYAIRHLTEEERAQDAKLFEEYVPEDSPMFAVVKTGFVDGFFAHIKPDFTRRKFVNVLFIINAAEVLLAIAFGLFMKADVYTTATMAYITLILGLSSTVIISCAHPFYHASKSAFDNDSAVIGDASLKEYSDGSVVFFDDKDIFPSTGVKINSVKVYGENRIDKVIYNAASVFARIGGPLHDVFNLATVEIGHSEDLELLEGENNGLYCSIDGVNIYLGSNDYMKSKGFETPYGENDANLEKGGIRLMYMADENEILAKFIVQYTVDSEYELIFKQLYKAGMCVGIRTNDPNIDSEFVMKKFRLDSDYPLRVVHFKPGREIIRTADRCESGIVSAGTVKSLLKALSICDRVKYVSKIHNLFLILSAVLSVVLVYAVTVFGKLGFGSAYAALYQLFWLIPMMLVTMFTE